jgi:hypothetical protein
VDPVEAKLLARLDREAQVAMVDRREGAAEDADGNPVIPAKAGIQFLVLARVQKIGCPPTRA